MQQVEIYGSPQLVGTSTLIGRQMTCRSGEPFVRLWWLGGVISGVRALWRRDVTVLRHRGPFDDIWGPLMTSGVLCCYHGTLMAALEALSVAVANGAFVSWHPLKVKALGPTYILASPLKSRPVPWTRLGPNLRSILCQISGPRGTDQGPRDK